jgi:hypothetical protein
LDNLKNIKCISLINIEQTSHDNYLKYLEIFQHKYIYIEQFIESKELPVDYNIIDTLKKIFDCTNIDWIKKIVSLELIFNFFKNIRLVDKYYDDISLALLLSTKNSVPIINNNIINNELIQNGLRYRKIMNDICTVITKNELHMPSIKTEFNIIRLNNCVILERDKFGFFFLNRNNDNHQINDIYLDWDTNLLGLYKLIDKNIELYVKIVISGRNKIIIGLNNIKGMYGYYFYKISDDVGDYKISAPTKLIINKNNNDNNTNTNNSKNTNINNGNSKNTKNTNNNKKEGFKFVKGKYSQKHIEDHPPGFGHNSNPNPKKIEEPKVFCPQLNDFPILSVKGSQNFTKKK